VEQKNYTVLRGLIGYLRYDESKTSYQRLGEANELSQEEKGKLEKISKKLNVVKLKQEIEKLWEKLWRLQREKKNCANFRVDSSVRQ